MPLMGSLQMHVGCMRLMLGRWTLWLARQQNCATGTINNGHVATATAATKRPLVLGRFRSGAHRCSMCLMLWLASSQVAAVSSSN